jgi:hypothetical protein
MTPEERKRRQAEYARKKYRLSRGLPEDAVLRLSPEEAREKRKAARREYDRKNANARRARNGQVTWAENVARRKEASKASRLAKEAEKRASDARKAAERQARKDAERCISRHGNRSENGKIRPSSPGATGTSAPTRKPGRLVASFGWNGW